MVLSLTADCSKHVDAYFEYRQLVGDSDGGKLLSQGEFDDLRRAVADPTRRMVATWGTAAGPARVRS